MTHPAAFARWNETRLMLNRDGNYVPVRKGKPLSKWLVAMEKHGRVFWWGVYRRTNEGKLRFMQKFLFQGEAATYIDDVETGRHRVYFNSQRFKPIPIDRKPKKTEP